MIKKSFSIFSFGFIFGTVLSLFLPFSYQFFIEALKEKVEMQSIISKNFLFTIIFNNIFASFMCSFGSYFLSRLFVFLKSDDRSLKISLFLFPYSILFINGLVLGIFLGHFLFLDLSMFIYGIFPHGIFEIPAIILSGAIGIEIGSRGVLFINERNRLITETKIIAKKKIKEYILVIFLLLIAGIIETYPYILNNIYISLLG